MKSNGKKILIFILLIVILGVGCIGFGLSQLSAVNRNNNDVEFTVRDGATFKNVLEDLEEQGLIKNSSVAYIYFKLTDFPSVKAGKYIVNDSLSLKEICDYLSDSSNIVDESVEITIIEGSELTTIAEQLSNITNLSSNDLLDHWNDEDAFKNYMKDYSFLTEEACNEDVRYLLEGYLFPDTYRINPNTTVDEVTRKFLDRTQAVFDKYKGDFINNELSIHQVFTLASVVQWEANSYDDMRKVAGVFFNRLHGDCNSQIGSSRLESSVTICYAADITVSPACELFDTKEKTKDSPYNTYYHEGLMPGCICAPGEEAIHAVLYPESSNYCFFFADNQGVHYSDTYYQHLSNY